MPQSGAELKAAVDACIEPSPPARLVTSTLCASTDSAASPGAVSASSATNTTETVNVSAIEGKLGPTLSSVRPKYVCVILHREDDDHLLVESRGPYAAKAANKLTCFGGKIETAETPLQGIMRECKEEMGWAPPLSELSRCVDLYVNDKLKAYFYIAKAPSAEVCLKFEEVCDDLACERVAHCVK